MKKHWTWIVLSFVVVFAIILRLFRLDANVPSLYADEVGGHYVALQSLTSSSVLTQRIYSLLQNGTATFTWLFGLSPLGARLPSAIYGTITVLLSFFLFYHLGGKSSKAKVTALLASFLVAISPWNYMLSRIGHPHLMLMIVFFIASLIFFVQDHKPKNIFWGFIFLALAVYEYPSMVVIAPILILFLLLKNSSKKIIIPTFLFLAFTAIIFIFVYHGFSVSSRSQSLAIWSDVNVTAQNNIYRGIAGESLPTKVFYNFPSSVISTFVKNYLSFFSPEYLFLKGDPILRHSTGMVGAFYLLFLPFMVYGAYKFFNDKDQKHKELLFLLIFVSPVPAAITKDGAGYLLRVVTMMPLLTYFSALGFVESVKIMKYLLVKVLYVSFIFFLTAYSVGSFLYGYFHVYPALSASHWEYGFKEVSDFQMSHPGKMLVIWEDKYPVWYFCFWQKLPGEVCDQKKINSFETQNGSRIDLPIENILFSLPKNETDLDLIVKKYKPQYLAIPGKYAINFPTLEEKNTPVQVIKYPDQTTSFNIFKISK